MAKFADKITIPAGTHTIRVKSHWAIIGRPIYKILPHKKPKLMPKKLKTVKQGLHIFKNKKGEIEWNIGGKNGRIIGGSTEGYTRLRGVVENLKAIASFFDGLPAGAIDVAADQFKADEKNKRGKAS